MFRKLLPAVFLIVATPAAAGTQTLPHDLSVWGMFAQADWVVKLVMIGLVLASVATWTVLIAKHLELARQRKSAEAFRDTLAEAGIRTGRWTPLAGGVMRWIPYETLDSAR